ncbi:MAG: SMP-30/gluconolactonase/LRE family protein [Cellvibrionaceae bacterium]|nr:SMP-30/gluconolactonase/LRE family protein [Cellvibrionaceae bacterium]
MIAYLSLWPVPVEPVAWQAPPNPGYVGDFAPNDILTQLEYIDIGDEDGPEDMVADASGAIYASVHSGKILRMGPGEKAFSTWVDTGGRPLGMDFDAVGNLIVADAMAGLLSISTDKEITLLTDKVGESPILYADDVDNGPDGKIYFSDASTRFGAKQSGGTYEGSLLDVLEHSKSGRVLVYDPADGSTKIAMDKLSFANGIAMDPAGEFILINETSEYRIHKLWIGGDKAGQSEVVIDQLPGFPDNIVSGEDGRFWFGLVSPRLPLVDKLADKPWLRKMVQRLPAFIRPAAKKYGHVVAIDSDGKVLASLQDPAGAYPLTTGVLETDQYLYVSSLMATVAARLPKPEQFR